MRRKLRSRTATTQLSPTANLGSCADVQYIRTTRRDLLRLGSCAHVVHHDQVTLGQVSAFTFAVLTASEERLVLDSLFIVLLLQSL
jgi:hypothetical protein